MDPIDEDGPNFQKRATDLDKVAIFEKERIASEFFAHI